MARETSYFVQSFNAGKGGNLKADTPIACKSATGAAPNGRTFGVEQTRCRCLLINRRSRDGRL